MKINTDHGNGSFQIISELTENNVGAPPGALVIDEGKRILLGQLTIRIGRGEDATIQIDDPEASRIHAEIRQSGSTYIISDLSSTNGTIINGNRITEHVLRDYDTITIGKTSLRFEAS